MIYVSGLFNDNDITNQIFQLANIIDYANKHRLKIGFKENSNLIFKTYFDTIDDLNNTIIIHDFNLKNYEFSNKTKKKIIDIIYSDIEKMQYTYNLFNKIKDFCYDDDTINYIFECDENNKILIKNKEHTYIIKEEDDYTKLLLIASFMENGIINKSNLGFLGYTLGVNKSNVKIII